MLVLSRRAGEEIVVGNETRVVVVEVRGTRVRLGFIAPRDLPIHRKETLDNILDFDTGCCDEVYCNEVGRNREEFDGYCDEVDRAALATG